MGLTNKQRRIAEHYGREEQARQLMEECGELIAVTNKCLREDYSEESVDRWVSEVADVLNTVEQNMYLHRVSWRQILDVMAYKIDRQIRRFAGKEVK